MPYQIENVSRSPIHENLATKDEDNRKEAFILPVRGKVTLTDAQWNSPNIQKHIKKGRLRSRPA